MKTLKLLLICLVLTLTSVGQIFNPNGIFELTLNGISQGSPSTITMYPNDTLIITIVTDSTINRYNEVYSSVTWYGDNTVIDTNIFMLIVSCSNDSLSYRNSLQGLTIGCYGNEFNGLSINDFVVINMQTSVIEQFKEQPKLLTTLNGYKFDIDTYNTYNLKIYNVTGQLLFETNNPTEYYKPNNIELNVYSLEVDNTYYTGKFITK